MNILNKSIRTCHCERSEAIPPLENASDRQPRNNRLPLLFTRNNKGAAAVEFALVLPVLIVLVFGIIEFSLLLYDKQVITNASREGARYGIAWAPNRGIGEIEAEAKQKAEDYCSNYLITFGSGIPDANANLYDTIPGSPLTVTVTYHYDFLVLPNFIAGLAGGKTLNATTVMRLE